MRVLAKKKKKSEGGSHFCELEHVGGETKDLWALSHALCSLPLFIYVGTYLDSPSGDFS